MSDLRYAVRSLRRAPWYAATTTGVIALSMALALTVFAVVDGVLFKPLPYPRAEQLFAVEANWTSRKPSLFGVATSASDMEAWRSAVPEGRFSSFVSQSIGADGDVLDARVDDQFFEVLGISPRVGGFQKRDFDGRQPVQPAVVTDRFWRTQLGADPSAVGRTLRGLPFGPAQVVGILPSSFVFPEVDGRFVPDVFFPKIPAADPKTHRGAAARVIVRLPAATPPADARVRMQAATTALRVRYLPPGNGALGPPDVVRLNALDEGLRATPLAIFRLVFATAIALMLIACVNATGIGAARAQDRFHELALRRALGSGGIELIRLVTIESLVIAAAGAAVGLAASTALLRFVAELLPANLRLLRSPSLDGRVFGFAVLAAIVCALLTAIWPVRAALSATLHPRAVPGARRHAGARRALIAAQVAVAFVMALGGVLLARSLVRVWAEDPGFRVDRVLNVTLRSEDALDAGTIGRLLDDVRHAGGVAAAGGSSKLIFDKVIYLSPFTAHGSEPPAGVEAVGVTSGFLDVTGLKVAAGRWFTEAELASGAHIAVVSQTAAAHLWPGKTAIDQVLVRAGAPYMVAGVVADARLVRLDREASGNIYFPNTADSRPRLTTLLVRVEDETRAAAAIQTLLASSYPRVRVRRIEPLAAALGATIRIRKFQAVVFSAFGIAGLTVAGIGVFALAAIVTARRTREFGVRVALGAQRLEIVRLAIARELTAIAAGLSAGLLAAFWLVRTIRSYTYKTGVYDPSLWALAALLLVAVSLAGAAIPAAAASRVDPIRALREV
jgi:predicted permease